MTLAILIVDVQKDFLPGGALEVPRGNEVIEPINKLMSKFPHALVYLSRDWHPRETAHFKPEGPWPPHCIENTEGAQFADTLQHGIRRHTVVTKGDETLLNPDQDTSYSAFRGYCPSNGEWSNGKPHLLAVHLSESRIKTLIVCGLATDYCVKATVLDALAVGFSVMVYTSGCRAVGGPEGDFQAYKTMMQAGALMLSDT